MTDRSVGPAVNWDALADVWQCFESDGLQPQDLESPGISLVDPVLVIGAGAGLVPEALYERGFEVTSWDGCHRMAHKAMVERSVSVEIVPWPSRKNVYSEGYKTIIVSSGVMGDLVWRRPFLLDRAFTQLGSLLQHSGSVIVAMFTADNDRLQAEQLLELSGKGNNNHLFLDSPSLEICEERFVAAGVPIERVRCAFQMHTDFIENRIALVSCLGQVLRARDKDPVSWLQSFLGYDPCALTPEKLEVVERKSLLHGFQVKNRSKIRTRNLLIWVVSRATE